MAQPTEQLGDGQILDAASIRRTGDVRDGRPQDLLASRADRRRLLQLTHRRPRTQSGQPILPGQWAWSWSTARRPPGASVSGLRQIAHLPSGVTARPRCRQRRAVSTARLRSRSVGRIDGRHSCSPLRAVVPHRGERPEAGGPQSARPSGPATRVWPLRAGNRAGKWPVRDARAYRRIERTGTAAVRPTPEPETRRPTWQSHESPRSVPPRPRASTTPSAGRRPGGQDARNVGGVGQEQRVDIRDGKITEFQVNSW